MSHDLDRELGGPLCRRLAGVDEVSDRLAASVLRRSRERFGDEPVDAILAAFQDGAPVEAIAADPDTGDAVRAMTYCLYTASLPDPKGKEAKPGQGPRPPLPDPADHFESLVWRVVQAHPPALSGGYFGHWRYPPEDAHPVLQEPHEDIDD